jgi:ubiquinone/menaquinone biosynthesis C-methylase UbiE
MRRTVINDEALKKKIKTIQAVFDLEGVLSLKPDKEYIQKYYKANKLAYSFFHTYSDKIYMGVSRDGIYKEDDLLEAARTVEKYIKQLKAARVLELASGRGATSAHLAKLHPDIEFAGIELSQGQLDFALKKARKIRNYKPAKGDYHDLGAYEDASFEIVFVIEALCYSEDKAKVFSEVKRVLKPGGVFIVLDGYTKKDRTKMSAIELESVRLTETGMAVSHFESHGAFMVYGTVAGFSVISDEDVSEYILPTLTKFEALAVRFFKHPRLAKAITKLFSKEFAYNAISGLLMPDLIKGGLASYYITVFKK